MLARVLLIAMVTSVFGLAACEKTNHENIDKWPRTQKGPGKLKKAFSDEGLDPDLSAHAGTNMVRMGSDPEVREVLESMSPARRVQVIEKFAPRLWDVARIEKEDDLPGAPQITAKDALIGLRKYASDPEKLQIDTYLIDWYATISYEGRSKVGAVLGAAVMRMVGPAGGKKLMTVANATIASPGQDKAKNRVGDELMLGLAASGNPDAVKYVLDIAKMDRGDATLSKRAMNALHTAYVNPNGLFDLADPAALVPNLDALVAVAKDESMPGQAVNDAIELIRAAGAPACFAPLLAIIPYPHKDPRFRYAIAYAAIHCGGTKSFVEVVQALPDSGTYAKDELAGAVSGEIAKLTPRATVQEGLRRLLEDKHRMARWVAIEALTAMKSVEDAPKIAALSGAKDKLVGFWGDQSGKDAKDRKEDPTLGQRAKDLADALTRAEAPK